MNAIGEIDNFHGARQVFELIRAVADLKAVEDNSLQIEQRLKGGQGT